MLLVLSAPITARLLPKESLQPTDGWFGMFTPLQIQLIVSEHCYLARGMEVGTKSIYIAHLDTLIACFNVCTGDIGSDLQ